jgi:hypothetical protein
MPNPRIRQIIVIAGSLSLATAFLLFRSGIFTPHDSDQHLLYAIGNNMSRDTTPVKDSVATGPIMNTDTNKAMMYSSKTMMPVKPYELIRVYQQIKHRGDQSKRIMSSSKSAITIDQFDLYPVLEPVTLTEIFKGFDSTKNRKTKRSLSK